MRCQNVAFAAVMSTMLAAMSAVAQNAPGVTDKEIKVGGIWPFSGPASTFSNSGKTQIGYVNMMNERGGVNGRKINFIVLDDAYSPPKTVEQVRRLVEGEGVSFIHGQLGTPTNAASIRYVNQRKVPHVFIGTGGSKFTNFKEYPYTTTATTSYETEAKIFARYVRQEKPDAKVAILYQNDDLGRDYVNGFKAVYGADFASKVAIASTEVSDPTIDSQIVNLKASGASVLMVGASPKAAAQAIRKNKELKWDALVILSAVSSTIAGALEPAGLENSVGAISSAWAKDPADPRNADDPEMKDYLAFMAKYVPGLDPRDDQCSRGYIFIQFMEELLKQAGNDLSRENILRVSRNMPYKRYPMMLDGVTAGTDSSTSQMLTKLRLQRFNGKSWDQIGEVVSAPQDAT